MGGKIKCRRKLIILSSLQNFERVLFVSKMFTPKGVYLLIMGRINHLLIIISILGLAIEDAGIFFIVLSNQWMRF
jgi:hypothetical protein